MKCARVEKLLGGSVHGFKLSRTGVEEDGIEDLGALVQVRRTGGNRHISGRFCPIIKIKSGRICFELNLVSLSCCRNRRHRRDYWRIY